MDIDAPRPIPAIDSVFIEELTWMEVRDAIKAGKTIAIVGTGGIEQNGPYVATGKHNYVLEAATENAIEEFASEFGAKWPKAVSKIEDDREALLAFYDYPAQHWRHLRTTNPIESVFAPVRARTDVTKGPGSRQAGMAMIFKLGEAAEGRWRKLTGSNLVALVRAGAEFRDGELVEGSEEKKDAA